MSVTAKPDDGIPHGLRGYRKPYNHRCDVCRAANTKYNAEQRAKRAAKREDELAVKRAARNGKPPAISTKGIREAAARRSESKDSVGDMERAVIEECAKLERAKERPTLVVAARNLAKIVDTPKMSSIHTSTTKQIMSILADLHGDTAKAKATGRRKSGGRLATVGALTKVKRAQ